MKASRFMAAALALMVVFAGCRGAEADDMGIVDSLLEFAFERVSAYAKKHDPELYRWANRTAPAEFADAFVKAALDGDIAGMRQTFAKNAVDEIGEGVLDGMLEQFVDCFHGTAYSVEKAFEGNSSGKTDHGKKPRIIEGSVVIKTDTNEYRAAIRCCDFDDWEADNIGIWSLSVIDAEKDGEQEHAYFGDGKYSTGVFFDVPRWVPSGE